MDALPISSFDGDDAGLDRLLAEHALVLSAEEARKVRGLLGRDPTLVEMHIFNTMWSEHCSYKSSRAILKELLPTEGPRVVLGPIEDAGIVRIAEHAGKSWCLVVGHESHNHPSQVVPYEGAATGVGGILRDLYCMGADVFGLLDPLRFGDPEGEQGGRVREIARGVVDGIWGYANAVGVPNLGGDTVFHPSFDDNCLVNVVAFGIVEESRVVRSRVPAEARDANYVFILVGKPTDDSGFGGATFASVDLDEDDVEANRGAVQAPDPFLKRVLAVACRDLLDLLDGAGVSFGFKDLGAGGIACVTSELAQAGGVGAEIDLGKVPVSLPTLPAEVIACSETQERFCLAVPEDWSARVLEIFNDRYELSRVSEGACAAVIGRVRRDGRYVLRLGEQPVCDADVDAITQGIRHDRPRKARQRPAPGPAAGPVREAFDLGEGLDALVGSLACGSRAAIYRHYDTEVQGNTMVRPGEADACVVTPVPGAPFAIAVSADGDPAVGLLDPWAAGAFAVEEAVRNVAAVGGRPLCITDCLNYGNPELPEVMEEFREGVRGIADACRALGVVDDDPAVDGTPIPVISGNVSFYNQSAAGRSVAPSPIVSCAGWLPDAWRVTTQILERPGDALVLVGMRRSEVGGAEISHRFPKIETGAPRPVDFDAARSEIRGVLRVLERGLARACHDISGGGIALAICEMTFGALAATPDFGVSLDLDETSDDSDCDAVGRFFGEMPGFVLEVDPEMVDDVLSVLRSEGAWARSVGRTTCDGSFTVRGRGRRALDRSMLALARSWRGALDAVLA
ncbi:MAG: phosphoribosylformylglycinamidine synthase subunit PurL [Gemmatimonadetes bacterium]|nr:phosphoribosylformylglycinamidine synthase subunit PurL [Gemmatimonadota bacterium]